MLPTKKSPPKQDHADLTVLVYGPSKIGKEFPVRMFTPPNRAGVLDVFQSHQELEELWPPAAKSPGKHP